MRLTQNIDGLDRYIDVPDGADSTIDVFKTSGWVEAPEPVQANPALAPGEPETFPTEDEPKPSRRKAASD